MKAYVELIQRKEREIGCDVLTHQKVSCFYFSVSIKNECYYFAQWSGADYSDNLLKTVTGGYSSTAAMGKGVTESQFASIAQKTKSKL